MDEQALKRRYTLCRWALWGSAGVFVLVALIWIMRWIGPLAGFIGLLLASLLSFGSQTLMTRVGEQLKRPGTPVGH